MKKRDKNLNQRFEFFMLDRVLNGQLLCSLPAAVLLYLITQPENMKSIHNHIDLKERKKS